MRLPVFDFGADLAESLEALRANEPNDRPYYGLFSGGKDSVALHEVARMAGLKRPPEWHYNLTTLDPPSLVRFIRKKYEHVKFNKPRSGITFFRMAGERRGFPTRRSRWCCDEYKESLSPPGAVLLSGIRAEESPRRAKSWDIVGYHRNKKAVMINPLFKWASDDLWDFINGNSLKVSHLYSEGFHRLGCIGCPLAIAANRIREFERWPRYHKRWQWVFKRTWERRSGNLQKNGRPWFGDVFFSTWRDMWDWWLHDRYLPGRDESQQELF